MLQGQWCQFANGVLINMENKSIKYKHFQTAHNLRSPKIIVPLMVKLLKPKSVIDIGCGIGTFLHVFKENGVDDILGVDGSWVDRKELIKHIPLEKFLETDLEKGYKADRKYDLALCLEVVEHLKEESVDAIVKSLTQLSDVIVFSAAIPGQFGQNHINEQWPEYWQKKFSKLEFEFMDVFRPVFWNNKEVDRWYKQNMFLAVRKGNEKIYKDFEIYFDKGFKAFVHPEYYNLRANDVHELSQINIEQYSKKREEQN